MKIAVITATRAEYGLLLPLIRRLLQDDFFQCHVIATGTHLLERYGNTVTFIERDGIPIKYRVSIMDDTDIDQSKVIANALEKFSAIYNKEQYDAIVVLGDRYELFGFCIPALLQRIPIIHIHGGERTEGAVDEQIRHAITKMSTLHFPSIPAYAKRIIQMGETPDMVFPVGALGIDNILHLPSIPYDDLCKELQMNIDSRTAIVTYHPVTLEDPGEAVRQTHIVMDALLDSPFYSIVTMPNSDSGGNEVLEVILQYIEKYPDKFKFIKSLGQKRYLSCLKYAGLVLGNSSSGIIETASFGIPTINIGDRQKGRIAPDNVLHCDCDKNAILHAIDVACSDAFRKKCRKCSNPYGNGNAALKMVEIIKGIDWNNRNLIKKVFFDIDFGDITC